MLTALDERTALILIDLQKGIVAGPKAHPTEPVVAQAARLAAAFRQKGLPVVLVHVDPFRGHALRSRMEQPTLPYEGEAALQELEATMKAGGFTELVPELDVAADDIVVLKGGWNAFFETDLHELLQGRGVTGIVLGGISTSIGVEGTARAAYERGYNLSFATDAMTDRVAAAHENSVRILFPRMGQVGTVADVLALLG